jgi:hypothetical protein
MHSFNPHEADPTEDSGAFIGGALICAVLLMLLIGLGKVAPPGDASHPDRVSNLHVEQSSISR